MWCSNYLYPRQGNEHMLYSDEVVVGRFLNEKDGGYSGIHIQWVN